MVIDFTSSESSLRDDPDGGETGEVGLVVSSGVADEEEGARGGISAGLAGVADLAGVAGTNGLLEVTGGIADGGVGVNEGVDLAVGGEGVNEGVDLAVNGEGVDLAVSSGVADGGVGLVLGFIFFYINNMFILEKYGFVCQGRVFNLFLNSLLFF